MNTETVKVGSFSAHLWLASDGRWKWHTRKAGKRILCAAKTIDRARTRAKAQLVALRQGKAELAEISPALISEFNAWRAARLDSPTLTSAASDYIKHLRKRKVEETRIIETDISNFARAIGGKMADVTVKQVADYLDGLAVGPRRFNNVRSHLAGWFRWARVTGLIPDATTAPERVHLRKTEDAPVGIYTPPQFANLLCICPPQWRLALAIGGLAGLRSEEIYGLTWEDLRPDHIQVRSSTSKNKVRRLVPIQPALAEWIKVSKPQPSGMVAPSTDFSALQKWLKRHHKFEWVHNGLRHSFGTYRCAVLKNIHEVSYEMGNSADMVRKHYLEMQPEALGKLWFTLTPKRVKQPFEKETKK